MNAIKIIKNYLLSKSNRLVKNEESHIVVKSVRFKIRMSFNINDPKFLTIEIIVT